MRANNLITQFTVRESQLRDSGELSWPHDFVTKKMDSLNANPDGFSKTVKCYSNLEVRIFFLITMFSSVFIGAFFMIGEKMTSGINHIHHNFALR